MRLIAILTPADIGGYEAHNPETGVASRGGTFEEALANLRNAVAGHLKQFPITPKRAAIVTHFDVALNA